MLKDKKIIILAMVAIIAMSMTAAGMAAIAVPTGLYVEGNGGTSKTSDVNPVGTSLDGTGFGWNVNLGFKFMPYFATEVGYTHYAKADITAGPTIATDTSYAYDFALKGLLPVIDSGINFFAKIGIARIMNHIVNNNPNVGTVGNAGEHSSTSMYYGLGGEYAITPQLLGVLQWGRAKGNGDTGTLDLYSAGLAYIFD